ncbi:MAG TPA: hypothetical protein PKL77_01210 [Candidatus Omnitrophota bacterium]|nr:hypothetical protein [Candidatus Omnitrophota bacterium]HPT07129.1 hypothetical protein [Candidatus Omnitrophota bacterium]
MSGSWFALIVHACAIWFYAHCYRCAFRFTFGSRDTFRLNVGIFAHRNPVRAFAEKLSGA